MFRVISHHLIDRGSLNRQSSLLLVFLRQEVSLFFRREPSLPHDLHQGQVQSKHWTSGFLRCHLGSSRNHVRHAGTGEADGTMVVRACTPLLCDNCHCMLVCACVSCSMSRRSYRFQTQRRVSLCLMTSSKKLKKVGSRHVTSLHLSSAHLFVMAYFCVLRFSALFSHQIKVH